jgi:gas vesicle protein
MKTLTSLVIATAVAALALTGCQKSGVDTKPLEKSFASAEPAAKSGADKAVSEINAGNYAGAMAELQKLGMQAKLTDEQQQAIKSTLEQVKEQIKEKVDEATKDAKKGLEDMQKSLAK